MRFPNADFDFDRLSRKAVRVVQYEGNNKLQMLKEDVSTKGYRRQEKN